VPARAWRRVTWRNGTNPPRAARCTAVRVTPANEWRNRRLAPEVWLLCEQEVGLTPRIKYFFVHLSATASLTQLVRLAHQRWAIEQHYQDLKTELGLDHFEGRSFPAGIVTWCSPQWRMPSYSGSGCAMRSTQHSRCRLRAPSSRRFSRRCCLPRNRTISNGFKNYRTFSFGSNKAVLAGWKTPATESSSLLKQRSTHSRGDQSARSSIELGAYFPK